MLRRLYQEAVVIFLSKLSGLDEGDAKEYFKLNGKAAIIVNTSKKFN